MEHESNTDLHPLHINALQNNFQWTSTQTFNSMFATISAIHVLRLLCLDHILIM